MQRPLTAVACLSVRATQQLKPLQKYLNAQTGEHVTVGKYTVYIRNQVAEGGYGVVFRCKEVGGQERSCALKVGWPRVRLRWTLAIVRF